jgi:cyclic nucleotide gated channel alpha 3
MRTHNVPVEMQRRVQRWYDYSWSRGRMSGAGDVHSIKLLPDKLKTELALHVNLGTLKKVFVVTASSFDMANLSRTCFLLGFV